MFGAYYKPSTSNAEVNNLHIKNARIDKLKNNKIFLDNTYLPVTAKFEGATSFFGFSTRPVMLISSFE